MMVKVRLITDIGPLLKKGEVYDFPQLVANKLVKNGEGELIATDEPTKPAKRNTQKEN